MSCEFVRPCGRLGDELIMIAEPAKIGRRLAFLRITFYQKGEVCAYGSQTVAITPDSPPMTHRFTPDGVRLVEGAPRIPSPAKL
jgi:acyl-coenzyme A thioesterase 13